MTCIYCLGYYAIYKSPCPLANIQLTFPHLVKMSSCVMLWRLIASKHVSCGMPIRKRGHTVLLFHMEILFLLVSVPNDKHSNCLIKIFKILNNYFICPVVSEDLGWRWVKIYLNQCPGDLDSQREMKNMCQVWAFRGGRIKPVLEEIETVLSFLRIDSEL